MKSPITPLGNILDCMNMILYARSHRAQSLWLATIGEADHMAEIHRQLDESENIVYTNEKT